MRGTCVKKKRMEIVLNDSGKSLSDHLTFLKKIFEEIIKR